MKVIIDSTKGFELEDTDTGVTFQFAGNLAALNAALTSGLLGQQQIERIELAGGHVSLDTLTVTGY